MASPSTSGAKPAEGQALLPARLWLPLVVAAVVSIAILGVAEYAQRWFTGAQAEIGNGLKLRAKLLQLEKTVLEAETAQRGYLLSRKPAYLEPFERSVQAIRPQQRELLDMAFQDKPVRDRLQELSGLIALKLAEMDRSIKVASAEEFERTLAVLDGDEGRQMTDKIRKSFAELNAIVSQQMESNTLRWQESMETSRSAIVTAVGLDVALIAMLGLLLIRDQRRVLADTRT